MRNLNKYILFLFIIPFFSITRNVFANDLSPQEIYEQVNNSVVIIYSYDFDRNPLKQGSGVVINDSGFVITNYHIFSEGENIVVYHNGVNLGMADIINADIEKDILILKIDNEILKTIPIGNSNDSKIGEKIYAIGSPLGYENTISEGIISGIRNNLEEKLIQITASISSGSSGGAIVNSNGELIGISTYQEKEGQNLNFAIPINDILEFKNSFSYDKYELEGNKIFLKGYNAYKTGKYEDAVYYYSGFLKLFEAGYAYFNRGLAFIKLERYDEAIIDFTSALQNKYSDVKVYYNRGIANLEKGNYESAMKDFNFSISSSPENSEFYNKRGECYLEMGDFKNAIKDFTSAIKFYDSYSTYFYNRGVAFEYSKDKISALRDYSHAIELFPTYYNAYYSRAILYNELNQFENSINDFQKCIEFFPESKYPYNNIGWVYFNKGDYINAINYLLKCFQIDKTDWDALLGIAASYFKKGDSISSEKYLKMAIRIESRLKKGIKGLLILEKEGYTYKKSQKKIIEEMFDELN